MYEELSGPDGEVLASSEEYAGHDGNKAYERRVMEWSAAGWDAQQSAAREQQAVAASAQAAAVAEAVGPVDEWSDEQCYEHLFGDLDRGVAARKVQQEKAQVEGRVVGMGYRVSPRSAPQ
jgi:hypothetical protein